MKKKKNESFERYLRIKNVKKVQKVAKYLGDRLIYEAFLGWFAKLLGAPAQAECWAVNKSKTEFEKTRKIHNCDFCDWIRIFRVR